MPWDKDKLRPEAIAQEDKYFLSFEMSDTLHLQLRKRLFSVSADI
jgi:hypothetical protein